MEVTNNLLNYKKIKIIQDTESFKFSIESVLLANFVDIRKKSKKIIDLCSGNIPIPLIISEKTSAKIYAVELQKKIYMQAVKNIKINNKKNIEVLNENAKNITNIFETDTFDIVTCNPPFFKYNNNTNVCNNESKAKAKHEISINIEEIIKISKKILKNNGYLYLVHRTERLIEIIYLMRKNNIEPKKVRFVYTKDNCDAKIVLICGSKNGKEGLKVMKPLILNKKGKYTNEILKMFDGR